MALEHSEGKKTYITTLWRVGMVVLFFIIASVVVFVLPDTISNAVVLVLVVGLAIVGVVASFCLAAGLLKLVRPTLDLGSGYAVADSLPNAMVITHLDGRIIYANAFYEKLCHAARHHGVVSVPRLFAKDNAAAEPMHRLVRAGRDQRALREDIRLSAGLDDPERQAGVPVWYRVDVRPMVHEPDQAQSSGPPFLVWSVEDISIDRVQQESVFLDLQRAIDFLDHAPAGFFAANVDGFIYYVNATLCAWLGYDLAQIEKGTLHIEQIISGQGAALLTDGTASKPFTQRQIDVDLVKQDGTILPVRLLHTAIMGEKSEGLESRNLVINRAPSNDIEDMLRDAQVRLSRFFNTTPFAVATIDADGRLVKYNAAFLSLFAASGTSNTEPHNSEAQSPFAHYLDEKDRADFKKALQRALQGASKIDPVDAVLVQDNKVSVKIFTTALEDREEGGEAAILYALDTSEQTALQEQFAQGQKMQAVGQLAGGVAHDFNNVLTAIIGFSDLLLQNHREDDPAFKDIMSIKQEASRAANLVRQLLAFSRRQTLRPQVISIASMVDDLSNILKKLIGEKIRLDVNHSSALWLVRVDLNQLEQVVINLVVNARDAMENGGDVTIETANIAAKECEKFDFPGMPAADYVMLEVRDTGTGIQEDIMEKIFDPFFTTKEMGKGTGLGLATVYGIVKQTEGFIYPESVVGEGTSFKIFIPRHESDDDQETEQNEETRDPADLTGTGTILLVEDEDPVRAFSVRALTSAGYTIHDAATGEEALEILEEVDGKIDLVLSDVVMPEMDGPTLVKKIKQTMPDLKVIFVSGYAEASIRENLADDQTVEFLPKPYSLEQLARKVKSVLDQE